MFAMNLWDAPIFVYDDVHKYHEPIKDNMAHGLMLQGVVVESPIAEHRHPESEQIYYVRSGRGIVTIDGEKKEVAKETVIFIPSGCTHGMRPLPGDEPFSYVCVTHYLQEPCDHMPAPVAQAQVCHQPGQDC